MESIRKHLINALSQILLLVYPELSDRNSNIARIFVAKNRNGPDGIVFSAFMDTSSVSIKVLERDDVVKLQQQQLAKQQQKEFSKAREVFRNMKNKETNEYATRHRQQNPVGHYKPYEVRKVLAPKEEEKCGQN